MKSDSRAVGVKSYIGKGLMRIGQLSQPVVYLECPTILRSSTTLSHETEDRTSI